MIMTLQPTESTIQKDEFSCIICGDVKYIAIKNGVRDNPEIEVVKCSNCSHIQLYPLPSIDEDKEYYDKDGQLKSLIPKIDIDTLSKRNAIWIEQQVEKCLPFIEKSQSTLEIGSGYGFLLKRLKDDLGFHIDGLELSAERRAIAQKYCTAKLYGINLLSDDIPSTMINKYDLILSFHLLEHISKPKVFVKKVRDMLRDNGMVVFEVPNINERFLRECPAYNEFKWLRAHVSYFSADILSQLFHLASFSEVEIRGVQNYSIENHLHWMNTGTPNIETIQVKHPDNLEWINKIYKDALEKELIGDALLVIAKK